MQSLRSRSRISTWLRGLFAPGPRRPATRRLVLEQLEVVDVRVPAELEAGSDRLGHLGGEQRELYEQLADSLTDHNLRTDEGVFGKLRRAFGG